MNPFAVIVAFTAILAVVIVWLQGRKDKVVEEDIIRVKPKKEISVIKKAEWVADEEPEPTPEAVSEPEPAPEIDSVEKTVSEPVPEPVVDDIADLSGVGPKYRQLLKTAGITSIAVIAESEPEALLNKLIEVNKAEEITKRNPTMSVVER